MADQWSGGQNGSGERWAINLPAVIGVVFVFLVGVIVWVVASSGDGDDSVATGSSPSTTSFPPFSSAETTTPLPMPSTTLVPPSAAPAVVATAPATLPPTVAPVATVPSTAAPTPAPTPAPPPPPPPTTTQAPATIAPTTVAPTTLAPTTTITPSSAGDLGVPGHPMMHPPCNGGYITVLGSAIGSEATAASMKAVLDRYSESNYLRTDVTCSSLTPSSNGQPIYVIYFGPFATDIEACAKRTDGPKDAYVRKLSNDVGPDYSVKCK